MKKILISVFWIFFSGNLLAADQSGLQTYQVHTESRPEEWLTDAVVEAVNQSTLSAQTSGRITEILFDVDDFVNKGEVLIRFSDKEQKAQLARAKSQLNEAQARLEQADKEYTRISAIYAKRLVARSALDTASADLKAAKARLAAAQASVKEASEQLEHTVIRAPYSGIVVKRLVEIGESVHPGTPLMTGLSLEKLRLVMEVPQSLINKIRERKQAARVILPDNQVLEVPQENMVFFPYADAASHTFRVRLKLPDGVKGLYPGMVIKAALNTGESEQLLVPQEAIVYRSEVTAVYRVLSDGRIILQQVRLGRTYGDGRVEIVAGLQNGDVIALDPIRAGVMLKAQQEKNKHE